MRKSREISILKIKIPMLIKGFVLETSQGGRFAKVRTTENEIISNVLMLQAYGEAGNMESDDSSLVFLLFPLGSKTNAFGIPYNVLLQPSLEKTEKAVGNFKKGNYAKFKANGENDITGLTNFLADLNAASQIKVSGIKVVGTQQATIAAPTGGATVDSEARTAITSILTALKAHGLVASS